MGLSLSESLKMAFELMFAVRTMDPFATKVAMWAAEARDLETRLHQAELKLALLSEEE